MATTVLLTGEETEHENINIEHITDAAKAVANEDVTAEVTDDGILVTCQTEEGAAALLAKASLTVFEKELVISKPGQSSAKASSKTDGVKLHVKNLPEEMTRETLKTLFEAHGTVNHSQVQTNKEGKSKGFGQVTMSTKEEADKAIAALNEVETNGSTISVILAPEQAPKPQKTEKGTGKGKSDKGKGKNDKGKGKGKAAKDQQSNTGWQNTSPMAYQQQMMQQMNPYMQMGMNPYAAYDPVYQQIMEQQMMTMQLYSSMVAQQQPGAETDPAKGKTKGKGKGKAKEKGTKVEGKFTGTLKSINFREDKGYGFINCAETKELYGRDVYVSAELTGEGAKVGDKFDFSVILDQRGQLRATNVKRNA